MSWFFGILTGLFWARISRWWHRVVPLDTDIWPGGADETLEEAWQRQDAERRLVSEVEAFLQHPTPGAP